MKEAMDLICVAAAKALIRWLGGLAMPEKFLALIALLYMGILALSIVIPASIGVFILWVGYRITLKLIK